MPSFRLRGKSPFSGADERVIFMILRVSSLNQPRVIVLAAATLGLSVWAACSAGDSPGGGAGTGTTAGNGGSSSNGNGGSSNATGGSNSSGNGGSTAGNGGSTSGNGGS